MKTKQKYICFIILIVLLFCWGLPYGFASSESIKWYAYDEGTVLGKIEKKKIFLHFWRLGVNIARKWQKTLSKTLR